VDADAANDGLAATGPPPAAGVWVLVDADDEPAAMGAVVAGAIAGLVAVLVAGPGAQAPSRVTVESSMPTNRRRKTTTS